MKFNTLTEAHLSFAEWMAALRARAAIPHQSVTDHGSCRYGPIGNTPGCFIGSVFAPEVSAKWDCRGDYSLGCLIDDGLINISVTDLSASDGVTFLVQAQLIHDIHQPDTWHDRLDELEATYRPLVRQ